MANIINVGVQGKQSHSWRLTLLVIGAVVLLAAGGVYTYFGVFHGFKKPVTINDQLSQADTLARQGNKTQAVAQLQQYINSPGVSANDKSSAYAKQAALLTGQPQIDALINAYNLHPTAEAAGFIGEMADQAGNKQVAIEYYQKSIGMAQDGTVYRDTLSAYQKRIKALQNA